MGTTDGRILHFNLDSNNFKYENQVKTNSEVTDLIRSNSDNEEFYVSGHINGSINIFKNSVSTDAINLKEADNQKILALKISGKHLAAMQEIPSEKYKIIVYNLEKENK